MFLNSTWWENFNLRNENLNSFDHFPSTSTLKTHFQDIQVIYHYLQGLEPFASYHDSALRTLSKTVRYEWHEANDVLYT